MATVVRVDPRIESAVAPASLARNHALSNQAIRHFVGEGNYVTFLKSPRRDLCRRISKPKMQTRIVIQATTPAAPDYSVNHGSAASELWRKTIDRKPTDSTSKSTNPP